VLDDRIVLLSLQPIVVRKEVLLCLALVVCLVVLRVHSLQLRRIRQVPYALCDFWMDVHLKLICCSIDLGWGIWQVSKMRQPWHFFELFLLEDSAETQVRLLPNFLLKFELLKGGDFWFSGLYRTLVLFKMRIVMRHFKRRLRPLRNRILFRRILRSECMNLFFSLLLLLPRPLLI